MGGRAALLATAIVLCGLGATPPAIAKGLDDELEHCVVRVIDVRDSGEMRTTEPMCGSSREAAMSAVSAGGSATTFAIGVHFDGPAYTGSSFTVVGDDCTGGWLNLNAAWINRVSSTLHGCPRIRHFDRYNLTGTSQTTLAPGANLSALNNAANSLQYLP